MIRLSFRDKVGYIGQSPNVPSGGPYTSTPDAPWNSQEMASYTGAPMNEYFCPSCKSVNLFINKDKGSAICQDCNARFSTADFAEGNAFGDREIPRTTGLFNSDEGSTSVPSAHESGSIGGGSWSQALGKDVNYNQ